MEMFGIRVVGMNAETGQKLLLTIGFVIGILLLRTLIVGVARVITGPPRNERDVLDPPGRQHRRGALIDRRSPVHMVR